ncbi:Casparian strip membrane protein domain [Dillenia turbinata]|uniref:CASP-like protein n=1 Tax=Dillenia turbinata TaxID=194707 RepID=A0AAN8Z1C2_9MAGN
MEEVPGTLGTSASFALRMGQIIFASSSLLFMCMHIQFYSYTSFCYLVTVVSLIIPWSLILGTADLYSMFVERPSRQPGIFVVIIIGDMFLSFLSLAAAASTASVTDVLLMLGTEQPFCPPRVCSRYQLSAAMAFLSWFFLLASSLFNLWFLPTLL